LGDQIKEDEMGGACSRYGGQQRCIQGFAGRKEFTIKEIIPLEVLGVDTDILICINIYFQLKIPSFDAPTCFGHESQPSSWSYST
jgi:hypothetical protein